MSGDATAHRGVGRPRDEGLGARRSAEILEAAIGFFARQGYLDADIQVLADSLKVGKGTIYRYFPSKETLFFATVDHGMNLLREAVDGAAATAASPLASIETAIRAYLEFFDAHPEIVELFIQERANFRDRPKPTYFVHKEAGMDKWHDLLRSLIRDGVMRDVPIERITEVISHLVYGTMFTNYFQGRTTPVSRQCDDILDVVFHGLLREGARS